MSNQYKEIASKWLLKAREHEAVARELETDQDDEFQLHMEAANTLRQCANDILWPSQSITKVR